MSASELQLDFLVPEEHPSYAGHFPGEPIVPGALLVQWVLGLLREAEIPNEPEKIESFKFLRKVHPGDRGKLNVKCAETGRIDIICVIAETPVFKGVFKPHN